MLRAVRFAARFDFAIDDQTRAAIEQQARELIIVSAERRRRATADPYPLHPFPRPGAARLHRLLEVVLPEQHRSLAEPRPVVAVLVVPALARFAHVPDVTRSAPPRSPTRAPSNDLPQVIFDRWKLSTDEFDGVKKLLREESLIRMASQQPWPKLQRMLIAPRIDELLGYCQAVAQVLDGKHRRNRLLPIQAGAARQSNSTRRR